MRLEARDLRRCRSCEAPIVWALTVEDRRMPVDALPADEGRLRLWRRLDGQLGVEVVGRPEEPALYRPHFATCPHADEWRRR